MQRQLGDNPHIGDVRGVGLAGAVEYVADRAAFCLVNPIDRENAEREENNKAIFGTQSDGASSDAPCCTVVFPFHGLVQPVVPAW